MTQAAVGEPVTLRCEDCGSTQAVANSRSRKIRCLNCKAPLTAEMATGRTPEVSTPTPETTRAYPPKLPKARSLRGKRPPGPPSEAAKPVEHEIDLLCESCDVLYRGKLTDQNRCETPRCKRRMLVDAATLPGRRPWEKEVSAGGFGQGKRGR
jgi:ribosomal protein S27E